MVYTKKGGAHLPWFVAALCFAWATFMTFDVLTRDVRDQGPRTNSGLSLSTLASASGSHGDVSAALRAEARAAVEAELARVRAGGDVLTQDTSDTSDTSGADPEASGGVPRKAGAFVSRRKEADRRASVLRPTRDLGSVAGSVAAAKARLGVGHDARSHAPRAATKTTERDDTESLVSSTAESAFLASAAPLPKSTYGLLDAMRDFPGFPRTPPVVLTSEHPKAYLFRNFLTAEECEHLKALAKKQLAPSTVVGTNGPVSSGIRTSAGTFLVKKQDDVVRRVEARMALAAGLPEANGEGMQILRYDVGQKYDPHYDYFHDTTNASPRRGGQRMATMLVYLADTESGGETTFPKARKPPDFDAVESESFDESSTARRPSTEWSDCAKRSGVPVRSEQGDAVLFWSLTDAYELDPGSLHGACPVLKGEKWTAVKWMRVAKFDGGFPEDAKLPMPSLSVSRRDSGVESERCQDEWAECADWAARGWCARNPEFMIGKKGARDSKGPACPRSCGVACT